jgi:glycosyltransferase involved in cell wall biosynthesis
MRIGWNVIDIDPKTPSGTLHHMQRWLDAVGRHDVRNVHVCYATRWFRETMPPAEQTPALKWVLSDALSSSRLRLQREAFFLRRGAEVRRSVDVLISFFAPPLVYRGPSISVILDGVAHRCPREFPLRRVPLRKLSIWKARGSLGWLTTTECTRRDVVRYRRLPVDRIRVVPIPVEDSAAATSAPGPDLSAPFALYCSVLSPRKNHLRLIEAFRQAFPNRECRLVLAGPAGWKCANIMKAILRAEADGVVRYLGPVDEPAKRRLYQQALFVAYPSLYEGFGMPVIEAFQAGRPVLTSSDSAMAEVGGAAVLAVNPESTSDLAAACRRLYDQPALREALAGEGSRRLALYTPARAAGILSSAIEELMGHRTA